MAQKTYDTPSHHRQIHAPRSLYRFLGSVDRFAYSDDRFRPTWKPRRNYRLTAEHRHQLCIHLAAHAVISSMGNALVYMVAVAPEGARSWTISERKTNSLGKLWGICSTSDFYCSHVKWDAERQIYVADREGWEGYLSQLTESLKQTQLNSKTGKQRGDLFPEDASVEEIVFAENRRLVRAQACGYLAGHIADGICADMPAEESLRLYDRRDTEYVEASDIAIAQGLTGLLPPGEYEHVVQLTEETLRRPAVWQAVQGIATELERLGLLEGDECEGNAFALLPAGERDWPQAPGAAPAA